MSLTSQYALGPSQFGSYGLARIQDSGYIALRSIRDLNANGVRTKCDFFSSASLLHSVEINRPVAYELSPGGHWALSLRNVADKNGGDPKPSLELEDRLQRDDSLNMILDASDVHSKVVGDTWFGGISFSPEEDERFVAYVANSKDTIRKSYFDVNEDKPDESQETLFGGKFEFNADWGEKYVGVASTTISILDTLTGIVRAVPGIKEDDTVGQPVWRNYVDEQGKRRFILSYTKWRKGSSRNGDGQMNENEEEGAGDLWKLGMIYCYQRPCSIHSVDLTSWLLNYKGEDELQHQCLTSMLTNARSPRYSPDGEYLIFIGRKERLASHNGCFALYGLDVGSNKSEMPKTILPIEHKQSEGGFAGFFGDQLPRNCFLNTDSLSPLITASGIGPEDTYAFVYNTMWGSRDTPVVHLVHKAMDGGKLYPITTPQTKDGRGCVILDARGDTLLCQTSSPTSPQQLMVTSLVGSGVKYGTREVFIEFPTMLSSQGPTQIHYKSGKGKGSPSPKQSVKSLRSALGAMSWRVQTHTPAEETTDSDISFESILISPPAPSNSGKSESESESKIKIPLLLVPHGGPHGCMPTSFVPSYTYLSISLGAAILHVNYRGSTGFGQRSIDSLCGKIGTNDVSDMMTALKDTLSTFSDTIDKNKVCVVGGSHGGFLTGHLIGQHPDTFKAAALRNPVTNIPAMVGVTDIPDWCFIETLGPEVVNFDFHQHNPANAEVLAKMFACSPVAHIDKVKTPALICLGAVDRRVPQSQGIEYHSLLKSRGIDTRMLVFPEDCHAIDQPCSEAEHFVAIAEWFQTYLQLH